MAASPSPTGLSVPLSLSSGPAISGGNPATGGATNGAFNVYFGGQKSALQTLVADLPMIAVAGLALWMLYRK